MKPSTRILTAAAALMLVPMYAFPIWRINLIAPQYPEGIGMYIHIDSIGGIKEHDLENINQLNHYIGMRVIDPLAIPELRWMPWILGALLALGLLAALVSSRKALVAWVGTFAVAAVAGLADFWKWSYDYGHDLDWEHAIIKVPGMVYQPPLIGVKQILNFRASSWPDVGGVAAFLAMVLALAALVIEFRGWRRRSTVPLVLVAATSLSGCRRDGPLAMRYDGTESCALCRMAVTDPRYGAQLVTRTGKVRAFDSVECLASYYAQARRGEDAPPRAWVSDFTRPGTLVRVDSARFLRTSGPRTSPMGRGLLAVGPDADLHALQREVGGTPLRWADVLALMERERLAERVAHAH